MTGRKWSTLKPAYAMYRFYAEVAGAKVVEVPVPAAGSWNFRWMRCSMPSRRGHARSLLANPNNPTGQRRFRSRESRGFCGRARKAAVLIDEAYYEFSGITALPEIARAPNLFVCRTFSKVFGMAAMRLGCLFSHEANIHFLHKAQSPYSVNMLAVMAAQAAVEDTAYVQNYVAEALAARELLSIGLEKLGIRLRAQLGKFRARAVWRARHRSARCPARARHSGARPQL